MASPAHHLRRSRKDFLRGETRWLFCVACYLILRSSTYLLVLVVIFFGGKNFHGDALHLALAKGKRRLMFDTGDDNLRGKKWALEQKETRHTTTSVLSRFLVFFATCEGSNQRSASNMRLTCWLTYYSSTFKSGYLFCCSAMTYQFDGLYTVCFPFLMFLNKSALTMFIPESNQTQFSIRRNKAALACLVRG